MGGLKGLYNMPLASSDLNTDRFWGVEGQGMMYGNKFLHNPSKDKPILAVIDSGTTLVMIPRNQYDALMQGIAKKLKNDKSISFVCTRDIKTN